MYRQYWPVEPTPEQRAWAEAEAAEEAAAKAERLNARHNSGGARSGNRANTGGAAKRLIAAHRGAQARAEARDRRVRDEDLALAGRPRLHQGNCQAMMRNEWGWW